MATVQQIRNDVVQACQLSGVQYSEAIIDRVFLYFGDKFTTQSIDLKTTMQPLPKRGFYFRYLEENNSCLAWERACQSGLLTPKGHPVDRLIPEIYETFPLLVDGIDFDVNYGLAKIWLFTKGCIPVEEAVKISCLPKIAKECLGLFQEHDLNKVSIFAADYQHNSTNLYFPPDSKIHQNPRFHQSFLKSLNFQLPSEDVLNLFVRTAGIAVTFSWESNAIERVCFYVPGFKRAQAAAYGDLSTSNFILNCPSLAADPDAILGWSFGPKESSKTYVKVEIDYTGDILDVFAKSVIEDMANLEKKMTILC